MNNDVVERVRRAIYDTFALKGRVASHEQIRNLAAADDAQLTETVAELAVHRHLVLDESANVVMAHPFTAVPLGFSVMGERTLWWGGCAWDSFAIPHLVPGESSVLVRTSLLAHTGQTQGYVMDLATLWHLASRWYRGRLDSPYQRMDPQSSAEYFRSAVLHGPFWGTRRLTFGSQRCWHAPKGRA